MLNDFTDAAHIYIACGYTDLRRGIDGLAGIVEREFRLDPFPDRLLLFCGRRKERIKGLYWESDGFLLLHQFPSFLERPPMKSSKIWSFAHKFATF